MNAQLFPREPRRMKQPAKDVLREQLVVVANRIIEQAEEIQRLRPIDGPFGRTFTFADPDGYRITLHDRA